jgi:hypothetical protein
MIDLDYPGTKHCGKIRTAVADSQLVQLQPLSKAISLTLARHLTVKGRQLRLYRNDSLCVCPRTIIAVHPAECGPDHGFV